VLARDDLGGVQCLAREDALVAHSGALILLAAQELGEHLGGIGRRHVCNPSLDRVGYDPAALGILLSGAGVPQSLAGRCAAPVESLAANRLGSSVDVHALVEDLECRLTNGLQESLAVLRALEGAGDDVVHGEGSLSAGDGVPYPVKTAAALLAPCEHGGVLVVGRHQVAHPGELSALQRSDSGAVLHPLVVVVVTAEGLPDVLVELAGGLGEHLCGLHAGQREYGTGCDPAEKRQHMALPRLVRGEAQGVGRHAHAVVLV